MMKKYLTLTLLLLLSGSLFAVPVADPRGPEQIVQETTSHLMGEINARREEFAGDPALLHELVNSDMLPLIDIEYSARLILGRAGREVTQEQLDDFALAMSQHLLASYSQGLLGFKSEEQVEVLPLKGKNTEKLTRVRTRLMLEQGGFVPIDFAFRKTELGWKAFDVTVEGISYVMTYRNQISPRVAEEGIDKVTADLRAGNIKLEE